MKEKKISYPKSTAVRENSGRQLQRRWTADERQLIFDTYTGGNASELAERFGVSNRVIITMASRMRHQQAAGDSEPWKVKRDRRN